MNELVYRNLSEDAKRQICAWKYGGEYDLYNLPAYEEMQVRQIGFMNPKSEKNYYGFWDESSKKLYPNKPLYLEVRTWNTRAVKCYEKAGFRIDGQAYELTTGIGTGTFYRMIREQVKFLFEKLRNRKIEEMHSSRLIGSCAFL